MKDCRVCPALISGSWLFNSKPEPNRYALVHGGEDEEQGKIHPHGRVKVGDVEPVGEVADDVGDDGGQVGGEEGAAQAAPEPKGGHSQVAAMAAALVLAAQPAGHAGVSSCPASLVGTCPISERKRNNCIFLFIIFY